MERILVVEDDLALSAGLLFELDSAGYVSVPAYNCAKARALLADGAFSLILLDVNLPDGNGFDLCREIKAQNAMQPVIFLTANDLEEDVLNGFDLGAEDYVTKPFRMQILLKRVEVALRRSGGSNGNPNAAPMRRRTERRTAGATAFFLWTFPPSPQPAETAPVLRKRSPSRPTNISCFGC